MRSLRSFSAALIVSLAFAPAFAADERPQDKTTLYVGATLIDGTGAKPRKGDAILVTGESIVAVGPRQSMDIPADAVVVDAKDQYVLPGLINVHEHMNTPPKKSYTEALLRRELFGGVTTTRNPADDLRLLAEIARAARLGEIPSPDIYMAAMVAGPSFFSDIRTQASSSGGYAGYVPWMQAITDRSNIPMAISLARGTSASGIKIYANLPAHLVKALTDEAHWQGIKSWSHSMVFPATPDDAVEAGVDVLSHVCDIGYQALKERPDSYSARDKFPLDPALFIRGDNPEVRRLYEKMARKGTILDATLYVYRPRQPRPQSPQRAAADKAPQMPPAMQNRCPFDVVKALTLQAHRAGVIIAAGTDGYSPWQDPYLSLHTELELLQEAGLPPLEVIKAATLNGAKVVGAEKEIGTLEKGKLANMVFVTMDPAEDVANLRNVALVVKRGEQYPRSAYVPLTEDEAKPRPMNSVKLLPVPADIKPIN